MRPSPCPYPVPPARSGRNWRAPVAMPAQVLLLAAAVLWLGAPARAQWGFGYGFGMGGQWGNQMATQNINNRSAAAASYAYSIRQNLPGTGNVYANNPNSYINNIRDASFSERFDPSTRRTIEGQAARRPTSSSRASGTTPNPGTTPTPAAAASSILPLIQFFSASGVLVWPSEAPVDGMLGDQKTQADTAARAVLQEVKAQGFAPVGLVATARAKLVDYGTPALSYLGEHTTPAVVDTFHRFLLSLYDSLGAAGTATPRPAAR